MKNGKKWIVLVFLIVAELFIAYEVAKLVTSVDVLPAALDEIVDELGPVQTTIAIFVCFQAIAIPLWLLRKVMRRFLDAVR